MGLAGGSGGPDSWLAVAGNFFGFCPACKASKLGPVDVLGHE